MHLSIINFLPIIQVEFQIVEDHDQNQIQASLDCHYNKRIPDFAGKVDWYLRGVGHDVVVISTQHLLAHHATCQTHQRTKDW
jgi:hypothetical protein